MKTLDGMRVCLIGGAGFIGHNLALALKSAGADVSIIDGLEVNNYLALWSAKSQVANRDLYLRIIRERLDLLYANEIPLYIQDARDYHALSRLLTEIEPQAIVHLAAVAHAGRSNKDPYSTFDHSLRTLENALDASRKRLDHFVFFSSSMVYGEFTSDCVTEETLCQPLGIYGALKFAGEKIVIAYNQVFDLPYTIVRPSALYGERCISRRVGQVFIENALKGVDLTMDGDGSNSLDFTYIDDLCHGIMQVLTHENALGETFNLTYGESRTIAQLLDVVRMEFPDVQVQCKDWDKLMPKRGTLDVTKARDLIDYQPKWPLEKGFQKYIRWYKGFCS